MPLAPLETPLGVQCIRNKLAATYLRHINLLFRSAIKWDNYLIQKHVHL